MNNLTLFFYSGDLREVIQITATPRTFYLFCVNMKNSLGTHHITFS